MSTHETDDVTLLHTVALARGMSSLLTANRVLLLSKDDGQQTCFAQGVPASTTQAMAAFTSDQEIVREMLSDSGIPVPIGRSVALSDAEPAEFAARFGFPDSPIIRAAWGGRQATGSLLAFAPRTGPEVVEAITATRAAAGPRWDRPAQPRGRMIIEEQVGRRHLRSLLIDGQLRAVTQEFPGRTDVANPQRLSPPDLHPQLAELLIEAAQTISGLATATVRISLDDWTQPLSEQVHAITFVDVHTNLDAYDSADDLALLLLESQCQGIDLPAAQAQISVGLTSEGHGSREAARDELANYLKQANLDAAVSWQTDYGRLQATINGSPPAVAELCDFLMLGRLDRLRPLWVEAQHN